MRAPPHTQIRRLGPGDVHAYRDLMLHAYEASPESFTSSRAERERLPLSWWENRLSDSPQATDAVFGSLTAQGLIGVCALARQTGEKTAHKVKVLGMFVHPSARGSGHGAALLSTVLAFALELPHARIAQLTVSEGNEAAITLYERQGFKAFGTEPMAVALANGYVNKIHMWRQLKENR